ncbi:MAG: hypothetical protein E6J66_09580 [Deltaproteobacteria bacterium]|nr:MAG: hypothetical protein E6J66_09580 [Deltaproteobacteria bacterium]
MYTCQRPPRAYHSVRCAGCTRKSERSGCLPRSSPAGRSRPRSRNRRRPAQPSRSSFMPSTPRRRSCRCRCCCEASKRFSIRTASCASRAARSSTSGCARIARSLGWTSSSSSASGSPRPRSGSRRRRSTTSLSSSAAMETTWKRLPTCSSATA